MEITIEYTCETEDEEHSGSRSYQASGNANLVTATIVALRTLQNILAKRYGKQVRITDLDIEITSLQPY